MYRRAAVAGPANPLVIVAVVVGLVVVAPVSVAVDASAVPTTAPAPTIPNGVRATHDLAWRHVESETLTLDAFLPARVASGRPSVLLIHGRRVAIRRQGQPRP